LKPVHEEISDLLAKGQEDRFSCPKEARKKAMDFLARREYGQAELSRKLADKGFDFGIAGQAVARLTDEGLQSDHRFAESFVQSRISQGKGPVRIRMDLKQRGIDPGLIEAALEASATDWHQLASAIRKKKFGSEPAPDFKARARQMRFLQYRGFEADHIQAAVVPDDD
jgi:regulatory protein